MHPPARCMKHDHPDWDSLQSALKKINTVVATINEAQREAEGLQRILNLQKIIEGVEVILYVFMSI